jgi:hypothetical protein
MIRLLRKRGLFDTWGSQGGADRENSAYVQVPVESS